MNKVIMVLVGIPVFAALGACSTLRTTVIPHQNGYTVVATADSGSTARSGALQKANETCDAQAKQLMVTRQHTIYQGAGKELGAVTNMIKQASFQVNGPKLQSTKQADDYKTTMVYRCK